ncbi:hypothetical protein C8Q78DRAFT_511657 [Trametes maxima]|nr:hypothetical protein C8Q78DRAFT_511657 [Trametes maxima]
MHWISCIWVYSGLALSTSLRMSGRTHQLLATQVLIGRFTPRVQCPSPLNCMCCLGSATPPILFLDARSDRLESVVRSKHERRCGATQEARKRPRPVRESADSHE